MPHSASRQTTSDGSPRREPQRFEMRGRCTLPLSSEASISTTQRACGTSAPAAPIAASEREHGVAVVRAAAAVELAVANHRLPRAKPVGPAGEFRLLVHVAVEQHAVLAVARDIDEQERRAARVRAAPRPCSPANGCARHHSAMSLARSMCAVRLPVGIEHRRLVRDADVLRELGTIESLNAADGGLPGLAGNPSRSLFRLAFFSERRRAAASVRPKEAAGIARSVDLASVSGDRRAARRLRRGRAAERRARCGARVASGAACAAAGRARRSRASAGRRDRGATASQQVLAAPLVADPAGDADREPEREAVLEPRSAPPVKQCSDAARRRPGARAASRGSPRARRAGAGRAACRVARRAPSCARRRGAARRAARSSGSSRARIRRRRPPAGRGELAEQRGVRVAQSRRVMRVHTGRRAQERRGCRGRARWPSPCRRASLPVTIIAATPAARARASTASRSRIEAVVREVGADVDEHARARAAGVGSGGAQRRRHRQARGAQRRQQAADHADDDRDDEAVRPPAPA